MRITNKTLATKKLPHAKTTLHLATISPEHHATTIIAFVNRWFFVTNPNKTVVGGALAGVYKNVLAIYNFILLAIHRQRLSAPVGASYWATRVSTGENETDGLFRAMFPRPLEVFFLLLPEICLVAVILTILVAASYELSKNRSPKVLTVECWRAACHGLTCVAALYIVQLFSHLPSVAVCAGYLYVSHGLAAAKLLVTFTSLFVLYTSLNYLREHTRHAIEYSIIMLLAILFLLVLVSSNNLILTFFAISGFSLNVYILILYDVADQPCREAALKYYYLSTLSSGLLLIGTTILYLITKDTTYGYIRFYVEGGVDLSEMLWIKAGVLAILFGFFFKLSAFPGHLWAVEVYEGSPLSVLAFFVLPVKVAVFVAFARLLNTGFSSFSHIWLPCVTLAAIGSLLWGALGALRERKTARFLGYASINQVGLLLLGLVVGTDAALRSAFFYLVIYSVMTGGFILIYTHLRRPDGQPFTALADFRGLGETEHLVAWSLAIFLFSMAGIPPLAGFFGKYYLFSALFDRGLYLTVVVALLSSIVSAYYYLRIIKTFWFEESIGVTRPVLLLTTDHRTLLSALEVSLWFMAIFAPSILPTLGGVIQTLVICGDASGISL